MCVIASPLELGVSGYFESFQTAHGRFPRSLINPNIPPPLFHFIGALEKRNTKLLSSSRVFCDHEHHESGRDTGRADSFPWTLILQVSSNQSQLQVTYLSRTGFLWHHFRYLVTTSANAAVLWQRTSDLGGQASSPAQLSVLRGHKREVTQVDFNRGQGGDEDTREQEELITCSYDRVILWNVQHLLQTKNPSSGAGGTTVAREMGDISSCRLVKHKVRVGFYFNQYTKYGYSSEVQSWLDCSWYRKQCLAAEIKLQASVF